MTSHFEIVSNVIVEELLNKAQRIAEVGVTSASMFEPLVSDVMTVGNDFEFVRKYTKTMWRRNEFYVQDIVFMSK